MTSSRTKRNAVVVGGTAAVTALSLLGGGYAYLGATTTSSAQEIESGTVSLEIEGPGGTTEFEQVVGNAAAGDSLVQYADLVNRGTLGLVDLTASQESSGALVADELGLDTRVDSCDVAWSTATDTCSGRASSLYASDFSAWGARTVDLSGLELAAGSTAHLRFATTLDAAAPNALQAETATIRYTINGTQGEVGGGSKENVVTGLAHSEPTATGTTVTWNAVFGARSYVVEYGPVDGATDEVEVDGATTSATLTGLTPATDYEVAVTAYRTNAPPVTATSSFATAARPVVQPTNWSTDVARMPSAQAYHSTSVVDGVVYSIGGNDGLRVLNTVRAYDPKTNTWSTRAPMPTPRYGVATSVVDGVIYAIGGYDDSSYLSTVEAYDPRTNTWVRKAPMPTARYWPGTSVIDGVIYAAGGDRGGVLTTLEAYDPRTNTWSAKAPMPTARQNLSASVVDGVFYAVGGYGTSSYLSTVEAYDPRTNAWSAKAPMPTARYGATSVTVGGVIYAVGGLGATYLATVEAYDTATNTWARRAPMSTARYGASAVTVDDVIYAFGGRNDGYLSTVERMS